MPTSYAITYYGSKFVYLPQATRDTRAIPSIEEHSYTVEYIASSQSSGLIFYKISHSGSNISYLPRPTRATPPKIDNKSTTVV